MDISGIQGGQAPGYQKQWQAVDKQPLDQQPLDQQPAVVKEAVVDSSASLQAYRQQSREPTDNVQVKTTNTLKNLDTVKAIEQMNTRLNELVKGVRQSNEELNKAAEQVAQMQGNLMSIVKNYPPYPIESMERRELLMSYMSLRKEIEGLMLPPPPQPVYEKVRSMWDAMFAGNGQLMASAVPALDAGSGDKQVQEAAGQLDKLGSQIGSLSDTITQALLQP